jgi:hypothetical protein
MDDMRYFEWLADLWPGDPIEPTALMQCEGDELVKVEVEIQETFKRYWIERGASGQKVGAAERRKVIDALVLARVGKFPRGRTPPGADDTRDWVSDACEIYLLRVSLRDLAAICQHHRSQDAIGQDVLRQAREVSSAQYGRLAKLKVPYRDALFAAAQYYKSQGNSFKKAIQSLRGAPFTHEEWQVSLAETNPGSEVIAAARGGKTYTIKVGQFSDNYWSKVGPKARPHGA